MLIDKAPYHDFPTPWHQDCAYWIDMPDKRAVSCWVALDDVDVDNGCMWFVPTSHLLPIRPHRPAGKGGGALECDGNRIRRDCNPSFQRILYLPSWGAPCTIAGAILPPDVAGLVS